MHDDGRSQIDGRILQHDQFLGAPAAPRQQAADAGGEFPDIERAFDNVGGAQFERQHLVDEIGGRQIRMKSGPSSPPSPWRLQQIPPFRLAETVADDHDIDAAAREQRFAPPRAAAPGAHRGHAARDGRRGRSRPHRRRRQAR